MNNIVNEEKLNNVSGGTNEQRSHGWYCPFCGRLITSDYVEYHRGNALEWDYSEKPQCECGCKIKVHINLGLCAHKPDRYKKCEYVQ